MRLRSESDASRRLWLKNERGSWVKLIVYNSPGTLCLQTVIRMIKIVKSYFTNLQNVIQVLKST